MSAALYMSPEERRDFVRRRRDELRAEGVPRCTLADFVEVRNEGTTHADYVEGELDIEAMEEHFSHYAKPGPCICCGARLGGLIGMFEWGLVHGEGRCGACGWPVTAYHRPKRDGEEVAFFQILLCAYPDDVVSRDEEDRRLAT